ncbi:MAG TPA: tetratricopeptide repeat protein [Anaeromyxobacteraceae bacterium]|nr:tetratricopeptide repeat protein [Anaeromyxobacteraceae bacterium]
MAGNEDRQEAKVDPPAAPSGAPRLTFAGFLVELKKRRVPRAALAYLIAVFGLLQGSEVVVRILELPHWVLTVLTAIAGVGFPVNLFVAWHFDIAPARPGENLAPHPGRGTPWGPEKRVVLRKPTWAVVGLIALVALGLAGWRYWVVRSTPRPEPKAQLILIADFDNKTGEGVFDGTLEPALGIAMEGASFITSYKRNDAKKIADQLKLEGSGLDEKRARLVAQREGIGVVTSGSVERVGKGYRVSLRAVDAFTGKHVVVAKEDVSGKDAVLGAVTLLAAKVRSALGDATPESVQLKEGETFSAASLEAAHEYAVGMSFASAGNWDEAIQHYQAALKLDPGLGRAFSGIAVIEYNRGHHEEAQGYFVQAMAHVDRMTDREKYRSRGLMYLFQRDPDKAIEAFTALVKQFPVDNAGLANLAIAYEFKGDFAKALEWGKRAIEVSPKNVPQRNNVGFFATYVGDFDQAIQEQQKVIELNAGFVNGYIGLALAQLAAGRRDDAVATWQKLAGIGPDGASAAAEGLADLAMFEGRLADARATLERGVAADLAAKASDAAGRKLALLAEVEATLGQSAKAIAAADRALKASQAEAVVYSAATALARAGDEKRARAVADDLDKHVEAEPRMYAELVRGEVELKRRNLPAAVDHFKAALQRGDTWLARLMLGIAYEEAAAFTQAQDELEKCDKRRGEATDAFHNTTPTYRLYPLVKYHLGRAYQGQQSPLASDSFKAFLGMKKSEEDPQAADARRRLGSG